MPCDTVTAIVCHAVCASVASGKCQTSCTRCALVHQVAPQRHTLWRHGLRWGLYGELLWLRLLSLSVFLSLTLFLYLHSLILSLSFSLLLFSYVVGLWIGARACVCVCASYVTSFDPYPPMKRGAKYRNILICFPDNTRGGLDSHLELNKRVRSVCDFCSDSLRLFQTKRRQVALNRRCDSLSCHQCQRQVSADLSYLACLFVCTTFLFLACLFVVWFAFLFASLFVRRFFYCCLFIFSFVFCFLICLFIWRSYFCSFIYLLFS